MILEMNMELYEEGAITYTKYRTLENNITKLIGEK